MNADSHSIINLGELSKPATVLVEKIADAIGGLARPWQIKRVAEAEAEAERIRAVTRIEITQLERRAMTRLIAEEARKQNNIESITAKALPQLSDTAKPENVEDDWIANFFDKCRLVSDEEMQKLWAQILSGEANSPGRFSRRTVGILQSMDKSDATMFSTLCRFACTFPPFTPVIYDFTAEIYSKNGINYYLLSQLESIGLVRFNLDPKEKFFVDGLEQVTTVDYFGEKVCLEFPKSPTTSPNENELIIGQVILTQVGEQLGPICGATPVDGFLEILKGAWRRLNIPISRLPGPPQF